MKLNRFGFSLMELIIVVAIISIIAIAGYSVLSPSSRIENANAVQRAQAETALEEAIKKAVANNNELPTELANVTSSIPYLLVTEGDPGSETYYCNKLGFEIPKINITASIGSLIGDIPVDPAYSNTTSSGYYVYRKGNLFDVSSCEESVNCNTCEGASCNGCPACGNGILEYSEVCDDGNLVRERCSNGILEVGTFCNDTCDLEVVLNEECDYDVWTQDCNDGTWYTNSDVGSGAFCTIDCYSQADCIPIPEG